MRKISFYSFLLFFTLFISGIVSAQESGLIRGKMIDSESGEPLMFASVFVTETLGGTNTDLDGSYEIKLEPGSYTLEMSYTGYAVKKITGVEVKANEVTILDIDMAVETATLTEVVVQASAIERSEVALLSIQKRSITIQDGISAEAISKYGSASAADAIIRTPGASVVDGKYVIIRGLGDRYSNALLNGLQLPSTDPYRNSTQLDLIPANLLDNVISSKTFTPDQPGDFTGGSVNIQTKSFPEAFTFSASASLGFNTVSSLNSNFLTHDGGSTDWLGYDDGTRAISDVNKNPATWDVLKPSVHISPGRTDESVANLIEASSDGFSDQMTPTTSRSFLNQNFSISAGNQYKLGENRLGVMMGLNYRRNYTFFENSDFNYFEVGGAGAEELGIWYDLTETRGTESPNVGGLLGLSYKLGKKHQLSFNSLYNHDADKRSSYFVGKNPAQLSDPDGVFESRVLEFRERELQSYQLLGEHKFGNDQSAIKLEWGASIVKVAQDEPNLRQFANEYVISQVEGDTSFRFNKAEFDLPFVYWRELADDQKLAKADITIPFLQSKSLSNMFKTGFMYSTKDRDFNEIFYSLNDRPNTAMDYNGRPGDFFKDENIGLIGQDANGRYQYNNYWIDEQIAFTQNSYTGTTTIMAAYGMLVYDMPKFRIVAGARGEWTDIEVASKDSLLPKGVIDTFDILPSINFTYKVNDDMNIRASYTQTLARPNMRELASFSAVDFLGGFRLTGNPNLQRTNITNYDLRWEWYPRRGELFAVSGFYKNFENPIVQAFLVEAANPEIQFQNIDNAKVYGVEFEVRKRLDFIAEYLQDFMITTNLSLIKSETDIPAGERQNIEDFNPNKGFTRPFYGQSDYLFNAGINYINPDKGVDILLAYNVFGRRLVLNSEGEVPDIFEEPRPQLDLTVKKKINDVFSFRVGVQNILDSPYKQTMQFQPEGSNDVQEYIIQEYRQGVVFTVGLSYNILPN